MTDPRRALPSVSALLALDTVQALAQVHSHAEVVHAARRALARARADAATQPRSLDEWGACVARALHEDPALALTRVLNATGVVLHTNLGRAPLAREAADAVLAIAEEYSDLEYVLESGTRGLRDARVAEQLRALTGAEDALVVNNGAAALMLALSALADRGPVAVSRGELVEIGGSFRVPDIVRAAGVELLEIGTTNRTHAHDYTAALDAGARAVLKVHRSNFRMDGFTSDVSLGVLAQLCSARNVPLVHDAGSGLLVSLAPWGLDGEPTVAEHVASGASVITLSGDKLLGGPQAGIAVGRGDAMDRMRRSPFARAMRVDKLTIAALAATLDLYRTPDRAVRTVPVLRMLTASLEQLEERAAAIRDRLVHAGIGCRAVPLAGAVGGGAFPAVDIPSAGISLAGDPRDIEGRLRRHTRPVIARITGGSTVLNLRSIPERDDDALGNAVVEALT